ncbi:DUF2931 family protein [Dyella sp. M7H15-1]|uniref:DUF2931 family protein n=1 Tax=Dyella sp. M7H15-1 TaxID=2501295 RepID=UPI0010050536|nr:DUF2931 family protein [Dyella sp. M7H15-1]QAU25108.1 DUF2931 family protein [Dyella sp. M7H15-1]
MRPLIVLIALLVGGCALAPATQSNRLPYDSWYLGFQAPDRMEVWLETANVEDIEGRVFLGVMQGTVAIAFRSNRPGWGSSIGSGAGRDIYNAGLPRRIYLRWQSLVERQTYGGIIEIPEHARRMMLAEAPSTLVSGRYEYQRFLSFGLAPGGWVKAWVMSPGSKPVEVLCTRVPIEPKGPYQGLSHGKYRPVAKDIEAYVNTHPPIPYDSWRCPHSDGPDNIAK